MEVTMIQIVIGAFGTVTKGLEDTAMRGRVETIQTTTLLRTQNTEKSHGDLRFAVTQTPN